MGDAENRWDVFICHAGEDKEELVRPLAEELKGRGLSVWYDEFELKVGDSLRGSINEGLAKSQHGIVVLSPAFFGKSWPESELDGLVSLEESGRRRILPIWHRVKQADVAAQSPTLAGRVAARTVQAIPDLVDELLLAIGSRSKTDRQAPFPGGWRVSPPPTQVELRMTPSGANLVNAMVGIHEGIYDFDSIPDPELRVQVADQIQDLRDTTEIWGELSLQEQERTKNRASNYVLEMLKEGLIPQVGHYERQLIGPDGAATAWKGVVVRVAHAEAIAKAQREQGGFQAEGGSTAAQD